MIHDKRDNDNWSDDVQDWEEEFDDGDVVIGPGYGSFRTMTVVHQIQLENPHENVVHRGVFWKDKYAERFAELLDEEDDADGPPPEDFDYGEQKEDGQYENYPTTNEGEFEQPVRESYVHEECGTTTTMTGDLPESVARDPTFYTKTFCAGCNEHVPVEEVHWEEDGADWVMNDD